MLASPEHALSCKYLSTLASSPDLNKLPTFVETPPLSLYEPIFFMMLRFNVAAGRASVGKKTPKSCGTYQEGAGIFRERSERDQPWARGGEDLPKGGDHGRWHG